MFSFADILSVGIGGFVGAALRFGVLNATTRWSDSWGFPLGTLIVNVVGCFAIGSLAAYAESRDLWGTFLRPLIAVGLLGGFTTFSAFGYESFVLLRSGQLGLALLNATAQLVVGVVAVWLGYTLISR